MNTEAFAKLGTALSGLSDAIEEVLSSTTTAEPPFLLTRDVAAARYNISVRQLDELYRRDSEFPILRIGRKVLIHRDGADAYFTRNIREVIEIE